LQTQKIFKKNNSGTIAAISYVLSLVDNETKKGIVEMAGEGLPALIPRINTVYTHIYVLNILQSSEG